MKKKLVVLLAVVMMFAFSASAYAATFSDVSERSVTEQDAIAKAVALGIIEGYEDGTFGPDKTITRAEFAKIAVTAAGAKETATMLEANASSFKDVRANSWYTGWINAAESLGIFKGDQNGNFRPNDTISNQEAITVLLRLLGYNDNLTGSWPVNYVTKANQIGLLDDVNIVASAAAKRGDVVVMLGEALDTAIVTYDKDTNEFVYKQTTKSGSSYITLLEDSFEGSYLEVDNFDKVEQVRDVAGKTLNWSVGDVVTQRTITSSTNNNSVVDETVPYDSTLIIDENTAVSYNSTGLFDLENHQGKVYYVKENGKLYARFIEVESYTQKVTDRPVVKDNKVTVNTTNYNAVRNPYQSNTDSKNSGYYMYFNDDDQVYRIVSDRDFTERSYYVKTITAASARLVGNDAENSRSKTVNMADADTLIYDNGKFISPSDLEVGDALMEIREGELYAKVADASGDLTRTSVSSGTEPGNIKQHKVMIGGTNYVYKNNNSETAVLDFYEENLDNAGISTDDVFNNNVKYLLNKDNSVSAIIVDETSTGTTLYGIVVDGGGSNGTWATNMNAITLYTQEGYTVTYDFDKNCSTKPGAKDGQAYMGQMVEYKLNSNGEIKTFLKVGTPGATDDAKEFTGDNMNISGANAEIQVKNNAYLVDMSGKQFSLAANVIIFEVGQDDTDVDPSLVTRSSLLGGGDFTPENLTGIRVDGTASTYPISAYASYKTNNNGAIKALAYTNSSSNNYHYGVVNAWKFTDADHTGGNDVAVTLVGDDKVYDWDTDSKAGGADHFIVYKLSGDKIEVVYSFDTKKNLRDYTRYVTGFNDGLISIDKDAAGWAKATAAEVTDNLTKDQVEVSDKFTGTVYDNGVYNVMTDANTIVYVLDSNSGKYREGALSDVSRNAWVYIPVIDKDGYADVVLIDEYPRDNTVENGNNGSSTSKGNITPTYTLVFNNNTEREVSNAPAGTSANASYTISNNKVRVKGSYSYPSSEYVSASLIATYGSESKVITNREVEFDYVEGKTLSVTLELILK